MRLVFFGTPEFAVPVLDALVRSQHEVVAAVTQPDRPKGRHRTPSPPAVKVAALSHGIAVLQPPDVNEREAVQSLLRLAPEAAVVISYGQKLSREVLEVPPHGCLNVHLSLLPKYRGAAPVAWALAKGEVETGVTIISMVERIDAGPVLGQVMTGIDPTETADDLTRQLAALGAGLIIDVLDRVESGTAQPTPQDESAVTYARSLRKSDGLIDWQASPERIRNLVRGMTPWPGAFSFLQGRKGKWQRLIILEARPSGPEVPIDASCAPGTIVAADDNGLAVATGTGGVSITRVHPAGKKPMDVAQFLRGHRLAERQMFGAGETA